MRERKFKECKLTKYVQSRRRKTEERAHWLTHFSTWFKGCFHVAHCLAVLFFVLSLVDIMSSPVVVNGAAETWLGGNTSDSIYILNINKLTVHSCILFVCDMAINPLVLKDDFQWHIEKKECQQSFREADAKQWWPFKLCEYIMHVIPVSKGWDRKVKLFLSVSCRHTEGIRTAQTNEKCIHEERKTRLNYGYACYHCLELWSSLLSKKKT